MRSFIICTISLLFMALYGSQASAANYTLFGILRPDANGVWSIQNDASHKPYGIDTYVSQTSTGIKIFTCCVATYTKAGSIQVSADDDFNTRVQAFSNLGLNNATIRIYVDGVMIDPAEIWDKLGVAPGSGNLWVTINMSN